MYIYVYIYSRCPALIQVVFYFGDCFWARENGRPTD